MKPARIVLISLFILFFGSLGLSYGASSQADSYAIPDLLDDEFVDDEERAVTPEITIYDPLEPMNRVFFEFNDGLYEWVLKPVTNGYIWLVPRELRGSFGNFFFNLAMPVRLLNSLLQFDFEASGVVLERFLINSTLGVYGLVDVADLEFDIKPQRADFGQTLGKWGAGEGLYLCWPLIGPSSVRGTVGLVADAYTHPIPYFHQNRMLDVGYYVSNRVNTLSLKPDLYDDLKRFSLDPYVASRQAYYEYRRALIER